MKQQNTGLYEPMLLNRWLELKQQSPDGWIPLQCWECGENARWVTAKSWGLPCIMRPIPSPKQWNPNSSFMVNGELTVPPPNADVTQPSTDTMTHTMTNHNTAYANTMSHSVQHTEVLAVKSPSREWLSIMLITTCVVCFSLGMSSGFWFWNRKKSS